jgi:hypothetical protein
MRAALEIIRELKKENRNLSVNEEKIIFWIIVSGTLSFSEIREHILPHTRPSGVHRSVRRLVGRGILEPVFLETKYSLGWRLSERLQARYSKAIGFQGVGRYRLVLTYEEHNRRVRRLARVLTRLDSLEWIAHESMVRANEMAKKPGRFSELGLAVPDLLTSMKENDKSVKVAWEIELTQKSRHRLDAIMEERLTSSEWDKTVYIVGSGVPVQKLLERNRRVRQTSHKVIRRKSSKPILFISEEELRRNGINAIGTSLDGESTLLDFLQNREISRDMMRDTYVPHHVPQRAAGISS